MTREQQICYAEFADKIRKEEVSLIDVAEFRQKFPTFGSWFAAEELTDYQRKLYKQGPVKFTSKTYRRIAP